MSIPKVINYCWFGDKELPELAEKCIASWKKYCPDYEIIRWGLDNLDISDNLYASQAYEAGKYSFTSDYARLKIIYENGGIYLDTDVELLKPLDEFLEFPAFFGIEKAEANISKVNTGIGFGAEKGNPVVKSLMDSYDGIQYINDGVPDNTACPIRNSAVMDSLGFLRRNIRQSIPGAEIFPSEYFCPMDWFTGETKVTNRTVSIHHFAGSWQSGSVKWLTRYQLLKWKILGIGFDGYRRGDD